MFERYALPDLVAAEREFLPAKAWWNFEVKFNVAGQQYVPAIRMHDGQSEGVMMHWGLIPSWAEGQHMADQALWIERDQIERSEIYGAPWLNSQRCILPVAGFYAWQLTLDRYRQPFFVRLIDRLVFGVAAICDRSVTEDDEVIESCSVICVPANELMADIANTQRTMPAILRRRDYTTWLQGTPVEARATLLPFKAGWMQAYPVSPRINSIALDDVELTSPVNKLP